MIHAQTYWNETKQQIEVTPAWPPLPSAGDHWAKPSREGSREKNLERKVLKIVGWTLTYEDQDGKVKSTHADKFRAWTDDARAIPRRLREYVVINARKDDAERPQLRWKKRPPRHQPDAYIWRKSVPQARVSQEDV